jgi:sigma-E factor negative regulatory protein RseA
MSRQQDREVLSALLDGEAAELESRRVLRDLDSEGLGELGRWQMARDVMARHKVGRVPEGFNARLSAALAEEKQNAARFGGNLTRVAVAASVAMATVFGWQYWSQDVSEAAPALAQVQESRPAGSAGMVRPLAEAALVAQGVRETPRQGQQAAAQPLSPMMVRHSEFAARHGGQGMAPYVRLVSMDAKQGNR